MEEAKPQISQLFGGKEVEYCHNPTAMGNEDDTFGYISDLTQAGTQKLGRITAEVDALVKHLKEAVASVGRTGRVVHIAHSQGALITALAAKQLSPLEMSQIEILTFGGAAAMRKTPRTPFCRVVNYYCVNDPLLFVVPEAEKVLRSGLVSDEEFCFLSPRIGDPIQDHNLLGPAYKSALTWEGQRFQMVYTSKLSRMLRPILLVVWTLSHAASESLNQRLKQIILPILRCVLILWAWLRTHTRATIKFLAMATLAIMTWIEEAIRLLRGEDKYVPVGHLQVDKEMIE